MGHYAQPKCTKCSKIIPFIDPKFCCFCGEPVVEEAKSVAAITDQEYMEIQCRQRSW